MVSDNDDAGITMRNKLISSLGSMVIPAELPSNVKDVSDLDDEQIQKFILQFDNEIDYILSNI